MKQQLGIVPGAQISRPTKIVFGIGLSLLALGSAFLAYRTFRRL